MAKQPLNPVLPTQLVEQKRLRDYRNNALGGEKAGIGAGLGAATTTLWAMGGLTPFLANPITAPIALLVVGAIAASPWIAPKITQWSTNNKVDESEKAIDKALKNPTDPKAQEQLQYHQNRLRELSPKLGNQSPKFMNRLNQLITARPGQQGQFPNGLQPGQQALPGQPGGMPTSQGNTPAGLLPASLTPSGQAPQTDFLYGRPAYNEAVPLLSPQQQAYQNETIEDLRQNNKDWFGPIQKAETTHFQENILPRVQELYGGSTQTGFGSAGPTQTHRAARGLAERLAAMRSNAELQREANKQRVATQQSFAPIQHGREPGFAEKASSAVAGKALELGSDFLGNYLKNRFSGSQTDNQQQPTETTQQQQPVQTTPIQTEPLSQFAPNNLYNNAANPFAPGAKGLLPADIYKQNLLGGRTR